MCSRAAAGSPGRCAAAPIPGARTATARARREAACALGALLGVPGPDLLTSARTGTRCAGRLPLLPDWAAAGCGPPAASQASRMKSRRRSSSTWSAVSSRRPAREAVSFEPEVDLPGVALAAGAGFGATVSDPAELPQVLKDALAVVHGRRSAVVSVQLPGV